jgi:hypothetical protein
MNSTSSPLTIDRASGLVTTRALVSIERVDGTQIRGHVVRLECEPGRAPSIDIEDDRPDHEGDTYYVYLSEVPCLPGLQVASFEVLS